MVETTKKKANFRTLRSICFRSLLGASAFANVVSLLALLLAGYSIYVSRSSDHDRYIEGINETRLAMDADENEAISLGGQLLMDVKSMLADKPSEECASAGAKLLADGNMILVEADGGKEALQTEFSKWVAAGRPPDSVILHVYANGNVGFATLLRDWHQQTAENRAFASRMLAFANSVIQRCAVGKTPPPMPSDIQTEIRRAWKPRPAPPSNSTSRP